MSALLSGTLLSQRLPKKMFTEDEDEQLKELVKKYGMYSWEKVAAGMETRTARQCKERFLFYLDPNINNEPYTIEEDLTLLNIVKEKGTRWSYFANYVLKDRTQYSLKNRWWFLQRAIKKIGEDISLEEVVKIIHEMPPPRPKPRPLPPPKTITTYDKIIILRPKEIKKGDSMEVISYNKPKQPTQNQKVESLDIIPIETSKESEPDEIPHELDIEPDTAINPQTDLAFFSESDFDDFFK